MKSLRVHIDNFNLSEFLTTTKKNLMKHVNFPFAIVEVNPLDNVPIFSDNKKRDLKRELLVEDKHLFIPFSSTNMGEPIHCADGNSYSIDEHSKLSLGDVDCIGFLIFKKGDYFFIDSSIHAGGGCPLPPSVDIIKKCDVFEVPMSKFISKYILS